MTDTLFGLDDWLQEMAGDALETELERQETIAKETCRHCKHRQRWGFDHSEKITQHCALQPTGRNRTGLKQIKVTDKACVRFEYPTEPSEDEFKNIDFDAL